MDDNFKLSGDETMRQLRQIAQSPGELQWRIELVSALERMRVTQEVSTRAIIQNQGRMRKDMAHLTPIKLAELMNAQIEQWEKNKDSARLRSGRKQVFHHIITAIVSIIVAIAVYKLTGQK